MLYLYIGIYDLNLGLFPWGTLVECQIGYTGPDVLRLAPARRG